ncbi:MAG: LptF/LptG family permease, partial [Candidatus Gastranaerophilales bacterium]|nr:LptF/LptG family permease [Candidatus Gastranaerophilales bacterium]
MRIKMLDKYIFFQVFIACFSCIFIFMIVWIMPETLLRTVQRTISGQYTIEMAASILIFELPKVLNIALPVGMLLGSILTFEKLSKDFEITVMRSCGFPFFRIISSVIILSILAAGLTFIVGSKFLPYSACKLKDIKDESRISQFVFPVKDDDGAMEKILIVSNFENNNIKDVIVLNFYDKSEKGSSILSGILISDFVKYNYKDWTLNTAKNYIISEQGIFEEIEDGKDLKVLEGESAQNGFKLMKYSINRDR